MGLSFRKRVRIAPGLYLNVSSGGTSWSVGVPGATLNFGGKRGARATVGIPGSGISYSHKFGGKKSNSQDAPISPTVFFESEHSPPRFLENIDLSVTPVVSADIDTIGEMGMSDLADMINQAETTRQDISRQLTELRNQKQNLDKKARFYNMIILRSLFSKKLSKLRDQIHSTAEHIESGQATLESTGLIFNWGGDEKILAHYRALSQSFDTVSRSKKIWDILSYRETDKLRQRTQADKEVSREDVRFSMGRPNCLPASRNDEFKMVPHLENRNGGDVYIFPGFLLIENESRFAVVSISDVELDFARTRFAETENVPADSKVEGNTWRYANKNGGPDRRFNDNHQIPWAIYGIMSIRFRNVLHEEYMISNEEAARLFAQHLLTLIEQTKLNAL
ncbi:DUF4236 domain-containing protein [Pantoea sp.]|uniref:DUF4236 domain-containing protein n=1 Tax=Pantoea sp. TaxID=69393 RepID=UPI0028AF5B05|nr:DUF4236 domain-containing protein [Pantoea sp.]